ncbi:MAG TPA: hypothetical protein VJT13_02495 [Xanthobacteraceae bacterium]|nr:hypothetical protein [Xanthobacteraceae bacterium]
MTTPPPGTPDLDLTLPGTAGSINGAVFSTGLTQTAGTGAFNAFLQIQRTGTEQGYNTDASAQYDELNSLTHNHSILLADVPIVFGDGANGTIEGVAYREFLLDLNEPNGSTNPYISLDALQIWQNEAGNLTNFTAGAGFAGTHTNYLAYDLDAGVNRWIALNADMAHGSGQSDYRILIPDSFFINDAAHRYVTLYSAFGQQEGWNSGGGFEEWGLHGESGGVQSVFSVHKTASVPGDTADTVGEVISYSISVSNTGNTALSGITVEDSSVSDLAAVLSGGFNVGDINLDGLLSVGETWLYTASHTVTQDDLDTNGGGDGLINNTVTADSTETSPVTASAAVSVEQRLDLTVNKTADVASVDAAGDVINYTITVQNTGNITLAGISVEDPQVNVVTEILDPNAPVLGPEWLGPLLNGDYNVGDLNENGIEDPGETFEFRNVGDTNLNGVEDPGETFLLTNVGDTNQNGFQDDGETFQFYNAGDTNHNGVEDDGETFQFLVSHAATSVDANNDTFNDGDTNFNNVLDVGETWTYSVSYTVTQDDIDNGGVVDPDLTHDNTATVTTTTAEGATAEASASVDIEQNPHVVLTKTADVSSVDAAGDVINYTIIIENDGNMTLTDPDVTDPSVSNLAAVMSGGFNAGDADQDGKLDVGETWQYTASHTVTQAEIDNGGVVNPGLTYDNTATVTTAQGAGDDDSASVAIDQNPHVVLTKTADVSSVDAAGDVINYTIIVENDGNMTLTDPDVTDPSVSNLAAVMSGGFNAGDADQDGKLDVGETWQYTASHTVTQADIDNGGVVDPDLTYDNTATVTTAQGAGDDDSASVAIDQNPHVTLEKTASVPGGSADAGEVISYAITIENDGNMTLTNPVVSDPSVSDLAAVMSGSFNAGDLDTDGIFDVGEVWQYSASHTVTQAQFNAGGSITNTASVATDEGASDSDSASVTVNFTPNAVVSITKSALGYHDLNNNNVADTGDTIDFKFQIDNLGNVPLHNVAVVDVDSNVVVTGSPFELGVGQSDSTTWAGSYTITALDTSNGFHNNDAVVTTDEASDSSGTVHVVLANLFEL